MFKNLVNNANGSLQFVFLQKACIIGKHFNSLLEMHSDQLSIFLFNAHTLELASKVVKVLPCKERLNLFILLKMSTKYDS